MLLPGAYLFADLALANQCPTCKMLVRFPVSKLVVTGPKAIKNEKKKKNLLLLGNITSLFGNSQENMAEIVYSHKSQNATL